MLSLISAENKHLIDTLDTLKYTDYMNKISAKKIFQIKEEIKKDKLLINKMYPSPKDLEECQALKFIKPWIKKYLQ